MKHSAAEYLAWERAQPVRYELFDGSLLVRPTESPRHHAATSSGPGERLELAGGAVLDVDAIFAGAFELPGD